MPRINRAPGIMSHTVSETNIGKMVVENVGSESMSQVLRDVIPQKSDYP